MYLGQIHIYYLSVQMSDLFVINKIFSDCNRHTWPLRCNRRMFTTNFLSLWKQKWSLCEIYIFAYFLLRLPNLFRVQRFRELTLLWTAPEIYIPKNFLRMATDVSALCTEKNKHLKLTATSLKGTAFVHFELQSGSF